MHGFCKYVHFFSDFFPFDKSLLLLTVTLRGVSNKHCLLSLFSFHLISLASISATVFKLCIHNEDNEVYYCKQNQNAEIYFCLLFLFLLFSISQSNVIYMEIFVKDV